MVIEDGGKSRKLTETEKGKVVDEMYEASGIDKEVLEKNIEYKKYLDYLKSGEIKRVFSNVLSIEEEAILKFYTTNPGYKNFNKALRGEIPITDFFRAQENLMNQALDKLPNYKTNDLLFRIENLTESQINTIYKKNEVITNKHFTSSSYDIDAIAEAMRERPYTIMVLIKDSKTGKKIEALSTLKKEKEIIFKSNTEFIVERVSIGTNPDTLEPIKTVILKEK
ncbi:ADP-ribosyltransferase [uncultured Psychroserpens sp.]|uniref:ADP-ribosyltransferase n=1 Tax=uncultured Psychroserpens sp. TaxID=255436 RepID=UPI002611756B|nr:ADP-ribosyltransferase [uncultured Psychroserpens sp.]